MRFSRRLYSAMTNNSRTFLFWFANEHSDFRIPELESLFKVCNLDAQVLANRKVNGPFILMNFPNEEGPAKLMSRTVLAHSCYEILGDGQTKEEMDKNVKTNFDRIVPYTTSSFRIRVETYGKTIRHKEKLDHIHSLDYLPLDGKVDLQNPECSLNLLLYYGLEKNQIPEQPYHWYFGRMIANGQRKLASKTSLKSRKFIGNTSMDSLLSLVMVNLATIKENDLVLDPFVGTGSILVAAAGMGAYVMGSDIDYLMLHGRTRSTRAFQGKRCEDESIRSNLRQYGWENKYIDVVVADASLPLWKDDFKFDAIITDPPYGIREPTERLGSGKEKEPDFKIKQEHLSGHIPCKKDYSLTDIYCDLMNFAANRLTLGGRLVYWIPISWKDYEEKKLPKNDCLDLIFNTEQVFNTYASRRLLVFQKTREPTASCQTEMDGTALMYRFKYFEVKDKNAKSDFSIYGKPTKRGQLLEPTVLEKVSISTT